MTKSETRHPDSLRVFFATEMWERYGFYVVQSLLALYLAIHFKWPDKQVYSLVGSFTALTYLSPVIGGWIADHLLGQKRTIMAGAIFLFFSYLALSFVISNIGLTAALAGIAVGTGLLKPNVASLLGNEYPLNSPKRESGFTIFYMGITSGIILGTTLPSHLNYLFGWSVSFLSAAFGMIIAALVFALGARRYRIADYNPFEYEGIKLLKAAGLVIALWGTAFFVLHNPWFADLGFGLVVILSAAYLLLSIRNEAPKQARKTTVISLLCIISVMFWAFYFQMFLSLTLFITRVVQPTLFGITFPAPYYVTVQSVGMLIFGYFLSRSIPTSKSILHGQRTGNKFLLSMLFMCFAYLIITLVCNYSTETTLLSPLFFVPVYLLISIAELLLSPVGLAAITRLASRHKVSTMMGIFYVSLGIGGFLSGKLAGLTSLDNTDLPLVELKAHYATTFSQLLVILAVCTAFCALLNWIIQRLLRSGNGKNK